MGTKKLVEETYKFDFHQIVVAPWLKELISKRFNTKEPYFIPNGVNLDKFHNENKVKESGNYYLE